MSSRFYSVKELTLSLQFPQIGREKVTMDKEKRSWKMRPKALRDILQRRTLLGHLGEKSTSRKLGHTQFRIV